MTREEAIKELQESLDTLREYDIAHSSRLKQALELAIQALSQEPCDDTVSIRKDALKTRVGNIVAYNVEWLKKHWQMEMDIVCGVKPCDDAISREAVLNAIEHEDKWLLDAKGHNGLTEIAFSGLKARVDALPSVTQKSGKWIVHPKGIYAHLVCNRCLSNAPYDCETNFCPDCGAKMVNPQESEE